MSLTCQYEYDPEPGDVCWDIPADYTTLKTKRARKCVSCGDRIEPGDIVAAFERYKVPEYDIEIAIYGEDEWRGPARATWYHCERCADLYYSLIALGFCIAANDDMPQLVREYTDTYGRAS